jgi:CRISPR-associated endonuclease/helicase Cas3
MLSLSYQARVLWGKTNRHEPEVWLPLYVHLSDSLEIGKLLWDNWLPQGTKKLLDGKRAVFLFLSAVHDIGKAAPEFQSKNSLLEEKVQATGLKFRLLSEKNKTSHALVGWMILKRHGLSEQLAVIVGGHHGKFPNRENERALKALTDHTGFNDHDWLSAQDELFNWALDLCEITQDELSKIKLTETQQALMNGLLIMTDWLASDASRFNLFSTLPSKMDSSLIRAQVAWQDLALTRPWVAKPVADGWQKRFKFAPRPMQKEILSVITKLEAPGIVVIEAPMGEGKTEAALAVAEQLASKMGKSGVYFALPTMATSNAIFTRFEDWVKQLGDKLTINLAHSKANLNDNFTFIKKAGYTPNINDDDADNPESGNVVVNQWFRGRKKGLLADFVVGTIDQVLLAALKTKHIGLRHLGLANKVVIIDECHAFDAYMNEYLARALEWLGEYQVPVIILSATLSSLTRKKIIDAYLHQDSTPPPDVIPEWKRPADYVVPQAPAPPAWVTNTAYPVMTYTEGKQVRQLLLPSSSRQVKVKLSLQADEQLLVKLRELLVDGGCIGIVRNTVRRAQELFTLLKKELPDVKVKLIHSRFLACDRANKEKELVTLFGPDDDKRPAKMIIVGTQVIEQSLDIDFDLLITDLAPMDLLLQRLGRLHRHAWHQRPALLQTPQCLITGVEDTSKPQFASGIEKIYDRYLLRQTLEHLPKQEVILPDQIAPLVQLVADERDKDYQRYQHKIKIKETRAEMFRIREANKHEALLDFTNITFDFGNDAKAAAKVRDSSDSLEVIVVQKIAGEFHLLPWIENGAVLDHNNEPEPQLAKAAATSTVNLPLSLCREDIINETIKYLEKNCRHEAWQKSPWLAEQLILVLNSKLKTKIWDYNINYEKDRGLLVTKVNDRT